MNNSETPKISFSQSSITPAPSNNIQTMFENFLQCKTLFFDFTVSQWEEERKKSYTKLRDIFILSNLNDMNEVDFHSFLDFNINKSWTGLQRKGKGATSDIGKLRETLAYLQDESIDIETRMDEVLKKDGRYKIAGMGKNIVTALLHIFNPDKYGVWNTRTEKALIRVGLLSKKLSVSDGNNYMKINEILINLKNYLNTDLTNIDMFMYYVDSHQESQDATTNTLPAYQPEKIDGIEAKVVQAEVPDYVVGKVEDNIPIANSVNLETEIKSDASLNLSDNIIQRSQIGAASVGNININIYQKSHALHIIIAIVLIIAIILYLIN